MTFSGLPTQKFPGQIDIFGLSGGLLNPNRRYLRQKLSYRGKLYINRKLRNCAFTQHKTKFFSARLEQSYSLTKMLRVIHFLVIRYDHEANHFKKRPQLMNLYKFCIVLSLIRVHALK